MNMIIENDRYMVLNGVKIERDHVTVDKISNWFEISVQDFDAFQRISEVVIDEIPKEIESIMFYFGEEDQIFNFYISRTENGLEKMSIFFYLQANKWRNLYSIDEFFEGLRRTVELQCEDKGFDLAIDATELSYIFGFTITTRSTLKEVYEINSKLICELVNKTKMRLLEELNKGSVISLFQFPEQVRTSCEQYLIYFTDFLKNLGINATSNLNHEAGQVLFSVTPTSDEVALYKIYDALEIYLRLPNVISNNYYNSDVGPSELQLMANIQHLKSQILLANAIAQSQNITIENLRTTVDQQQKIIDASILQHSLIMDNMKNEENNSEEILGGAVTLTKFEGYGFEISLSNIYRRIKEGITKK
ncbi:hypothetical protein I6N90_16690 [Paenibacillus sp. GSMTC-2017]|uniref:hypothetical protein n=1 Tax=Paenibacillus sp. GSMTC-2017 TaxID=2794350 RepID=UPI0018D9EF31|nr:hypothetical protein [Paenibacillus sp. GSMTC-2017]MBH5319435.1 hypothetical protein [Paenibacillus sp. GSMTC-2017]